MGKIFEWIFHWRRYVDANKHMKKIAIKKIQVKTRVRYLYALSRMAVMKKTDKTNHWGGVVEI